uniref:Immunoglobulin-binding protein 1 n=1 Tax=Parascaris univalens TaxID=6257 RepID=A0A915B8M5_PARUN
MCAFCGLTCLIQRMNETNNAVGSVKGSSLDEQFKFCERIIDDCENGAFSTKEMQAPLKECKEKLENLTREVSARELFSRNERVDELPTGTLQYLLLPSYLATTVQNIIVEPERRLEALDQARVYLRDFLERLLSYEVIGFSLPWLKDEDDEGDVRTIMKSKPDPSQIRANKLRRYEQQKEMEDNLARLNLERSRNAEDDSVLRETLMTRLRLFALKAVSELEQIDEERPLAEHMLKIRSGHEPPQTFKSRPSRPPIIITRDALQKKVFGLGYPSIPTVTVDEWYNDMMKQGRFGNMQTGSSNEKKLSESDEDNDAAEEEKRAHEQRWDDYKDSEWFIVFSCWLSSCTERMLMVLLLQTVDSIRIAVVLRGCRSMGQGS